VDRASPAAEEAEAPLIIPALCADIPMICDLLNAAELPETTPPPSMGRMRPTRLRRWHPRVPAYRTPPIHMHRARARTCNVDVVLRLRLAPGEAVDVSTARMHIIPAPTPSAEIRLPANMKRTRSTHSLRVVPTLQQMHRLPVLAFLAEVPS
jgi:hypothetical protein